MTGSGKLPEKYWSQIPAGGTALVVMGTRKLRQIAASIAEDAPGRSKYTPAALIESGTTVNQRVVTGTLETIADLAKNQNISPPALLVVGESVALQNRICAPGFVKEQSPFFEKNVWGTARRPTDGEWSHGGNMEGGWSGVSGATVLAKLCTASTGARCAAAAQDPSWACGGGGHCRGLH